MTQKTWHSPKVNKIKILQNYADQYDDRISGLLQECIQNSVDAYPKDSKISDIKIVMKYDADNNVLVIQDYGTNGMYHCDNCEWGCQGLTSDGEVILCDNFDTCPWIAFHQIGYSVKQDDAIGSRGMGKSLLLLSGNVLITRTTLPNGTSHASVSQYDKKTEDYRWSEDNELVEKLSSPGVKLELRNVIPELRKELLDTEKISETIQERWGRILDQNATIKYIIVKDGNKKVVDVSAPKRANLDTSQGADKAVRKIPQISFKYSDDKSVVLHNIEIYVAKSPLDVDDTRRGIAICKNGKQTIQRITDFDIPAQLSRKIYGWCDVDETLEVAENPSHTGYQGNHPAYKGLKKLLKDEAVNIIAPFQKTERITDKDTKDGKEIANIINTAIRDIPELSHLGIGGGQPSKMEAPYQVEKTKNYVYISRIEIPDKVYKKGDVVQIVAVIKNPTDKEVLVRAKFEYYDPTPVCVNAPTELAEILPPGTPENPSTKQFEFQVKLTDIATGRHNVKIQLLKNKWDTFTDTQGNAIKKEHYVWCEIEPPEIHRPRAAGNAPGGKPRLAVLMCSDKDVDYEGSYVAENGTINININGNRVAYARDITKSNKAYKAAVGDVASDLLIKYEMDEKFASKDTWTYQDIEQVYKECQATKVKLTKAIREAYSGE